MRILNGWKEVAQYLNLTERTAQRWERLGLPVRRVSKSRRSPIVAFHHEIEDWMRTRGKKPETSQTLRSNWETFRATRQNTVKLIEEITAARQTHRNLIAQIRHQLRERRTL